MPDAWHPSVLGLPGGLNDTNKDRQGFLHPSIAGAADGRRAKIKRKDFGMSFNPVLDGRFVVSDEITIALEGELVEQANVKAEQSG